MIQSTTRAQDTTQFNDISGHQYQTSIINLQSRGIVKGYPDGSYGVDRIITRAEMMKIIIESSIDSFSGDLKSCYDDVDDERYAPYICYATDRSMVKGIGDGRFGPENSVTFAEGIKMSLNAFDLGIKEGVGEGRYQPYLNFVHNNTIFSKYSVYPDSPMTRGQMAYLTHQLLLAKEGMRVFDNIRQVASVGCKPLGSPTPLTQVTVNGQTRNLITTVGKNYKPNLPMPLIVAFHGRTNSNADVRSYLKLDSNTKGNAIIVYPSGLPESSSPRNRQNPGDKASNLRDYALFDEIIKQFSQYYCINMDEIYVVGHSLGARFTNSLACARGDVIRGMGSVGGSISRSECAGPVASIMMHHPDDNLASFGGGLAARDRALQQNRCSVKNLPVGPSIGHCVEYECMADAPVIWCPHTEDDTRGYYYPHTRPGFATPMIWEFWQGLSKR